MIPISVAMVRSLGGQILRAVVFATIFAGCWRSSGREVVVYSAQDEEFAAPIFAEFTAKTGIHVLAKYDVESTKTVGLAQAIIAEKDRPRCDLFWNNELLHILRLQNAGLLTPSYPKRGSEYPSQYRSRDQTWFGFAARARVLLVNTKLVPRSERPTSVFALAEEKWRGKGAIAKPLFGTTATHAACLLTWLGPERGREFFGGVKKTCQILSGNKQVAQAVGRGEVSFGLTDTDDALAEVDEGRPVEIVFPDQAEGECGTLVIPNTLGLIRNAPHATEAQQLLSYLLSPEVEGKLAIGPSGQMPLHPDCQAKPRLQLPEKLRTMDVDFAVTAKNWEAYSQTLTEILASP
jgi:iron(III) transport system substrate-binding protein